MFQARERESYCCVAYTTFEDCRSPVLKFALEHRDPSTSDKPGYGAVCLL